jgi:hypothetical protein
MAASARSGYVETGYGSTDFMQMVNNPKEAEPSFPGENQQKSITYALNISTQESQITKPIRNP